MNPLLIIFLSSLGIILIIIVRKYIKFHFGKFFNIKKKKVKNDPKVKILDIRNKKIIKLDYKKLILNAEKALKCEQYDNAEKYFICALDKNKNKNPTSILKPLAYTYFKRNLFKKSIETYLRLKENIRLGAEEYFNLGFSYYKLGNLNYAKTNFLEALKLASNNKKYIKHLSDIYLIQRQYTKLENILLATLKEDNNIDVLYKLAELYEIINKKQKLKNIYKQILKKDPKNMLIKRKLNKLAE